MNFDKDISVDLLVYVTHLRHITFPFHRKLQVVDLGISETFNKV